MFAKNNNEKVARLQPPRHDQVNGLLDKGCSFEGKLTFDGTVQINGDFRGEVYSDGTLVIGTEARVQARILVDTLIVYGKIDGQIEAKSRIEMRVPAKVTADIKTKKMSIEDGVMFQGTCQMAEQADGSAVLPHNNDVKLPLSSQSIPSLHQEDDEDHEGVLVL